MSFQPNPAYKQNRYYNNMYGNQRGFYGHNNNIIPNNNKKKQYYNSLGYIFKGNIICDKNADDVEEKFKSLICINSLPKYDKISQEELRLADYKKMLTGNANNLNNIQNQITFHNINNTQQKNIFTTNNQKSSGGIFDNLNANKTGEFSQPNTFNEGSLINNDIIFFRNEQNIKKPEQGFDFLNNNQPIFEQARNNSNNQYNFMDQNPYKNSFDFSNKPLNNNDGITNLNTNKDIPSINALDPFNDFSSTQSKDLTKQDKISYQYKMDVMGIEKPSEKFFEELEQKYKYKENKDHHDISYDRGTDNDNNDIYNRHDIFSPNEIYEGSNQQMEKRKFPLQDIINEIEEKDKSLSKINNIYKEYEMLKSKYNNNLNKKISNNLNPEPKLDNKNILKNPNDSKEIKIFEKNIDLFPKNMTKLNNINSNLIKTYNNEKNENNNNNIKNEKDNNQLKNIDIPKHKENNEEKNNKNKNNELVPIELIPKLTKEGYKCIPSILELSRMTKEELKKVEGFKIYNQYGEVEFKEPVNLLGLDLDKLVEINKNMIDTADELDYYSKFRLFNIKVEDNELNKYKLNIQRAGGNFIEYKNNEMIWEYKKES